MNDTSILVDNKMVLIVRILPVSIHSKSADVLAALTLHLLLALNLPPTAPWWMGIIGCVFAIIIVKMLFGGLGQNFMNPALAARCFLVICFTARMTDFVYDGVTGATPLANLREGTPVDILDMFIGRIPGAFPVHILCHLYCSWGYFHRRDGILSI